MPLAKNFQHDDSNVIPLFPHEHDEQVVHVPIDVDPILYDALQKRAKKEQTTEQQLILHAILAQLQNKKAAPTYEIVHKKNKKPLTVIQNPDYKGPTQ